jgi:hypothetical protein
MIVILSKDSIMLKLSTLKHIHSLRVLPSGHAERPKLERFIQYHYDRVYEAQLSHFMPLLLGLYDANGEPLAALGLRNAAQGDLYLEQYLDQPIESYLQAANGVAIPRHDIVELGHFAVAYPEAAMWMILLSTAYLKASGAQWGCASLVPILLKALHKLGLQPLPLAAVDARRLQDRHTDWGRYYERQPVVVVDHLPHSFAVMQARLQHNLQWQAALQPLWQQACQIGYAR